jgi:hypothetical protein
VFDSASRRIAAADLLRKAGLLSRLQASASSMSKERSVSSSKDPSMARGGISDPQGRQWRRVRHMKHLLSLDGEDFVYSAYVSVFNRLPDSDGLVNYLTELQSGVSKIEIISRLRNSSEWHRSGQSLAGYRRAVLKTRLRHAFGFT